MATWEEIYKKKVMKASQAIRKIKTGAPRIFIGTGCGQPQSLVEELANPDNDIVDAEIYHLLTQGVAPYLQLFSCSQCQGRDYQRPGRLYPDFPFGNSPAV